MPSPGPLPLVVGIGLAACTGISTMLAARTSGAVALAATLFTLVLLGGVIWSVWTLYQRWLSAWNLLSALALREAELSQHAQDLASTNAEREKQWTQHLNALMEEVCEALVHLLEVQLPAAWAGEPVAGRVWRHEDLQSRLEEVFGRAVGQALGLHGEQLHRLEALRRVVVALMQRASASAHRVEAAADYLARQSGVPDWVVEELMKIVHEAAQQARTAQGPLVLCGERPGQSWQKPVPLSELVQAAAARISDYTRVVSMGDPDLAARPAAAEPLIHLLAELLANATQYSAPAFDVQVHVEVVQSGASITIDDRGVGMTEVRLQEVREIASGQRRLGLADLGAVPQTGLAVVGSFACKLGLTVDLRPSPYGGIRAIVLVSDPLLERVEPAGVLPPAEVPLAETPAPTATPSGLPVRQRPDRPEPAAAAAPPKSPWMATDPQAASNWMTRLFSPDSRQPHDGEAR